MSDVLDPAVRVRRYDPFAENAASRSRMSALEPTLAMINDRFCRGLRAALLQHLRRAVEIAPAGIDLLKHRELLEQLEVPSYLSLINMRPLYGTVMVAVDARLVTSLVESRFGGNGRFPIATGAKEFSPFELKSMRRVIEIALGQLAQAWEPVGRFQLDILRHEFNPQFAAFAPPDDQIVISTVDIDMDPGGGRLRICMPYAAIEPLQDRLVVGISDGPVDHDLHWSEALRTRVAEARLTLTVELAKIDISLGELTALRPGNVFEMDNPEILTVEAHGVPLFRGRWGRHGRRIGVRIEEHLPPPGEDAGAEQWGESGQDGGQQR